MQQNFRVLLVEDDDSLRVCLREFLADHGWVVAATARGDEAIALAQVEAFDFSILDFHLPGGATGLQVFQAIRRFHPLPAILMSGAANREEADLAQRAGFFTFLRKPLELDHLRRSVHMLIEHYFGAGGGPLGPTRPHGPFPAPASGRGPARGPGDVNPRNLHPRNTPPTAFDPRPPGSPPPAGPQPGGRP